MTLDEDFETVRAALLAMQRGTDWGKRKAADAALSRIQAEVERLRDRARVNGRLHVEALERAQKAEAEVERLQMKLEEQRDLSHLRDTNKELVNKNHALKAANERLESALKEARERGDHKPCTEAALRRSEQMGDLQREIARLRDVEQRLDQQIQLTEQWREEADRLDAEVERLRAIEKAATRLLEVQTELETIWPPKEGHVTGVDYARAWMDLRAAVEGTDRFTKTRTKPFKKVRAALEDAEEEVNTDEQ